MHIQFSNESIGAFFLSFCLIHALTESLSHQDHSDAIFHFFLQELLTRHKSTVAEFLSKNYDWVSYLSLWLFLVTNTRRLEETYVMHTQFKVYQG